ncbi:hypothetical protein D3C78_1405840 [compost metagenome]
MNTGGPDGRAVFVGAGHVVATVQVLERGAGTYATCQVLGLALGNRALQAGAGHDTGALEVVGCQVGRVEGATDQHRAGEWAGQGPVVLERGAAGGKCVHGGYCASCAGAKGGGVATPPCRRALCGSGPAALSGRKAAHTTICAIF